MGWNCPWNCGTPEQVTIPETRPHHHPTETSLKPQQGCSREGFWAPKSCFWALCPTPITLGHISHTLGVHTEFISHRPPKEGLKPRQISSPIRCVHRGVTANKDQALHVPCHQRLWFKRPNKKMKILRCDCKDKDKLGRAGSNLGCWRCPMAGGGAAWALRSLQRKPLQDFFD